MKFQTRKTFHSNLIMLVICVVIPCMLFCVIISDLWAEQIKEDSYTTDQSMLSLTSHTFDIILQDITKTINLIEADKSLMAALPSDNSNLFELPAGDFLALDTVWQDSIRTIMAKPYVTKVYMYLDRYPDFVFTDSSIVYLENAASQNWYAEYLNQDSHISLWATPLSSQSIWIFRRLPYIYFDEEIAGFLSVCLDKSYFDTLFGNLPQSSQRNIFILDGNGTQIYSSRGGEFAQYIQSDAIEDTRNTYSSYTTEDGTVFISVASSSLYHWRYISVIPEDLLLDTYKTVSQTVYAYVLLAFFISICLAILVTQRNYRPVRIMLRLIDSYNKTGTIKKIPKYSSDEFGYIAYNIVETLIAKQDADRKIAEEKLLTKEASLMALQSQINPHFLYNTLDAINWEATEQLGINNSVSKMLLCLSSNLRYITKKNNQFVTLQEELENLQQYISLCQMSTSYRIQFEIQAPEYLQNQLLPTLLLQPLVENTIIHGLAKKRAGKICISISDTATDLKITICDDGCGMSPEKLASIQRILSSESYNVSQSVGLKNIDSRLKLLYGQSHGLQISSSEGAGCCITILLPL